ncbi:hypothetical protein Tco_0995646 [Tanacetum coccineum]
MGNALVKLVKKVKKLEGFLKRRNVVLSDSEEEEPEAQGRKSQDDPLASLVQGLVTPSMTKGCLSLKPKSIDKGRRYKRRKETKGKKVVSSLDFQEEVDTGAKEVNTAEGVNTGSIKISTVSEQVSTGSAKRSIPSPDKGQRAGKAPMISEETPKKSKEQILQEEASLAEAIRLDTLQKEEVAKQDAEPRQKSGKRRKQMARKGLHTDLDKDDSEGSDEVSEQDDSVSGTKIPINPVPVAMKSPKDDLTEIYRIVMNRYGMDGLEDELEKFTMSNRHKDWLVQEQTALGKDFSNPFYG